MPTDYTASQAMENPKTLFAGYRVPHPLEHNVEIKLQTEEGTTPLQVLQESITRLLELINDTRSQLDSQLENISGDVDMQSFTPSVLNQSHTPRFPGTSTPWY